MLLKQSTARNRMVLMVDSADHVSGKTGLTLTITASKDGAAFASISPTVTERSDGWYSLALTTSHTDTLGDLAFHITSSGADPTDFDDQVVADLPGASVASVTGNVGGNVTGSVGSVVGAVGSVTGNVGGNVTGSVGSVTGSVGGNVVGTVASVVGNVGGNVTGSVGSLATQAKADVNAEVDAALADYDGPTNAELATALDPLPTAAENATAVWANGTRTLTAIDEDSTTLDLDGTIRSAVGLASANLDTQLGDLLTNAELATALGTADDAVLAQVALVKAQTDLIPSDPADASDIASAFGTVNSTLSTIAGYVDNEVAAIKAKTDQLTFTVPNVLDANIQRVNDVAVIGDGGTGTEWGPAP